MLLSPPSPPPPPSSPHFEFVSSSSATPPPPSSRLNLSVITNPSSSSSYSSFSDLNCHGCSPSTESSKTAAFFTTPVSAPLPSTSSSKTAAFFSRPFSSPPSAKHSQSSMPVSSNGSSAQKDASANSKTDDFFSANYSASTSTLSNAGSERADPMTRIESDLFTAAVSPCATNGPCTTSPLMSPDTRRNFFSHLLTRGLSLRQVYSPAPSTPSLSRGNSTSSQHSRTEDFFFTPSSKPTPPPSLRSASSTLSFPSHSSPSQIQSDQDAYSSSTQKSRLPLARLFPSRYSSIAPHKDDVTSSPGRGFVEVEEHHPHAHGMVPLSPLRMATHSLEPDAEHSQYPSGSTSNVTLSEAGTASSPRSLEAGIPDTRSHSRLAPLARLFPSRYSSIASHGGDSLPSISPAPSLRQGFVDFSKSSHSVAGEHDVDSMSVPREEHIVTVSSFKAGSIIRAEDGEKSPTYELVKPIGQGAFSFVWMARDATNGVLVAIKMIARAKSTGRHGDRTRASFVRETEVLQCLAHPAHPSLPILHAAFSLPSHHVLVLEHIAGGELFDVVNSDAQHARLTEGILQRIWIELVGAVEWMHNRNIVHRDIKLENILLTTNPLLTDTPSLPERPAPLIKLTDFGLARAIDPSDPWLTTRCGSESYAAPELLVADHDELEEEVHLSREPTITHRHRNKPDAVSSGKVAQRREGTYDGRETDAWALGVVLFALVTRRLPFDPVEGGDKAARKAWLMRIARGDYVWPENHELARPSPTRAEKGHEDEDAAEQEVCGSALGMLPSVRRIVARLLVRDSRKRARVSELWDDEWMRVE
ncbi:hypothetical protein EW146_g1241 [Bondarzewia mesenterica]|uniref:Protein kinase domain-containing protein n=1 Tax=Bondarzewia mesenterica TaxID=1095465 RepID=A0A4V6S1K4_9AGAM|nr:hypothetical protein EW146_g1241 [Bondarzewia mesenterica]